MMITVHGSRFRKILEVLAIGCAIFPATATGLDFGFGGNAFELSGFVGAGNSIRLSDPDPSMIGFSEVRREALVAQLNKARFSLAGTHPRDISSQVTLDLLYTSEPGRPFADRGEILLDEAYLDFYYKDYDVRVGLQKVIWGKSDLISPFDILTARDLTDPFVWPTIEDRIAQAGIRVNRMWGEYTVEAVLFPIWIRSRVPQAETDDRGDTRVDEWFPPMAIYPAEGTLINDPNVNLAWMIFLPTYEPMEKPKTNPSTATFGVKVNRLFGEYDVDFYLLSTMDPTPTGEIHTVLALGTIPEAGLNEQGLLISIDGHALFKRVTTLGAAGSTTLGPVALRSEMAIVAGKQYFRLFDPAAIEEALIEVDQNGYGEVRGAPKSHADWVWITGGDYEIPRLTLFTSSQLAVTKRFSHEEFYTQSATEVDWTFLVRRSFKDDHLSMAVAGMAGLTSKAVWISPAVSYTPPFYEDLELGARLNVFAGNEFSKVGMYGDQSSLVLNVRWLY